jgi:hypothetical protein
MDRTYIVLGYRWNGTWETIKTGGSIATLGFMEAGIDGWELETFGNNIDLIRNWGHWAV